jgi:hypothetical protein
MRRHWKSTEGNTMSEQEIAQALADWEAHQKRKAEVAARAK